MQYDFLIVRTDQMWVFEAGTFVPAAKIKGDKRYSIVADYLGTPIQMYDEQGEKTWDCTLDVYGKVANFEGSSLKECPFRYQGQYEDGETGLYYNRFRYYDANTGTYLSQDPIRLAGNNPTLYSYVLDPNSWVDIFGLFPFFRGAKIGETPSFEPRAGEYKINKETGLVQPTHGVSVFDNPESVSGKGFVPHEVEPSTVPDSLKIEQRGKDPKHYEIMPKEVMSEADYKEALSEIKCSN